MKVFENKNLMQIYQTWRTKFSDFYESERFFFTSELMSNVSSVLDVGCGGGGFGNALRKKFGNKFSYTGIDVNETEVVGGKERFPELNFVRGCFPKGLKDEERFDLVCAFGFFHMVLNWKKTLFDFTRFAKRFVNVSVVCRLEGGTVLDSDVSYYYYLNSGKRVPSIVLNIRELLNFCCHHELRVKKISFYGYHNSGVRSTAFRPLPESETIYGNLFLELFDSDKNPKRFGGLSSKQTDQRFFVPEVKIVIDGKEWNGWR